MSGDDAVGIVISVLIAAYLVFVLIAPERV
jgi:K+-transporting ATPase KdpF subunit